MSDQPVAYTEPLDEEASLYKKITWRILPLLTLCYVVSYLDRVNVGFAKLQMSSDLKFSETVYGLGAGIFFLFYASFEIPSNIIGARIGARKWIARIMVTWGVISAAFAFVHTPWQFYLCRSLLGIAEAGFFPGVILYLTYWYPAQRRSRIIASFMVALPLSGILGGPLSGWILDNFHEVAGLAAWRWMFLIEGLPAVALGAVVLLWLDDTIRHARWLNESEKVLLERNIQAEERTKTQHGSLKNMFSDRRVWLMGLLYFCVVMGQYGITLWLPTLVKSAGVSGNFRIGLITAVPYLASALAMICFGWLSDRTRQRRLYLALPLLLGIAGFLCSVRFEHNFWLAIASLVVAAVGAISATPLFWPIPTGFLGRASAAAGIAMITAMGNLGGFFSPYMIGWLKDVTHSGHTGMYVLSGFLLLGVVIVWSMPAASVDK